MGFFEPLPARAEAACPAPPPWQTSPLELGVVAHTGMVLARSDTVAVTLTTAIAYSSGVELQLVLRMRAGSAATIRGPIGLGYAGGPLPDDLFRFGVRFADGRKATSFGRPGLSGASQLPDGPVLISRGGGGGGDRWDCRYWLWPLPPPGPLTLACEWPARGIGLSTVDISASLILDAGARAEPLWP